MKLLRLIGDIFFWPGDVVRRSLGITVEEDGGIIRSFVNMIVWGVVSLLLALWMFN